MFQSFTTSQRVVRRLEQRHRREKAGRVSGRRARRGLDDERGTRVRCWPRGARAHSGRPPMQGRGPRSRPFQAPSLSLSPSLERCALLASHSPRDGNEAPPVKCAFDSPPGENVPRRTCIFSDRYEPLLFGLLVESAQRNGHYFTDSAT